MYGRPGYTALTNSHILRYYAYIGLAARLVRIVQVVLHTCKLDLGRPARSAELKIWRDGGGAKVPYRLYIDS